MLLLALWRRLGRRSSAAGHVRCFSSAQALPSAEDFAARRREDALLGEIDARYPAFMVWGCNTDVGKTLVSTGMAAALLSPGKSQKSHVLYVKPVQTGFPDDSDARSVTQRIDSLVGRSESIFLSNRTMWLSDEASKKAALTKRSTDSSGSWKNSANSVKSSSSLTCETLWSWCAAVSPHLAAQQEGGGASDDELRKVLRSSLWEFGAGASQTGRSWAFVETAGGVASPAPSGTLQCDLYRPLRLPGILVGDGRLGGISTTLAAYESLLLRGYETICIVIQDMGLGNNQHLSKQLHNRVPVFVIPAVPKNPGDDLAGWFHDTSSTFVQVVSLLEDAYHKRIQRLREMPKKASELLWWPFTQHRLVPEENVTVIDSRSGEFFSVYENKHGRFAQQFDACASWWTQGPDASLQHELAKQIAYAAGRYGHVMFPENVHEPGLRCAELLLQGVGRGWAHRVYISDNGSTATEIALKMALRKYAVDHGFLTNQGDKKPDFKVLALRGSYHGDTLGAMEAQAPSPYTGFSQQPWYSGRGVFLDPPTVCCQNRKWQLRVPERYGTIATELAWDAREDVFALGRDNTELAKIYSSAIEKEIMSSQGSLGGQTIAGLIIEPIIHAAGGMELVDPLFQRILTQQCKCHKIPVIFDEVFTGCWRLGAEFGFFDERLFACKSAWELLGCKPDIACYAKLLTGGTVPLAATLATQDIFQAFEGASKLDALLHGHSYTAHPVGCSAAVTALEWFKDPSKNPNLLPGTSRLQEQWDPELVAEISSRSSVERVISLGTLMALELRSTSSSQKGYSSLLSSGVVKELRQELGIYTRPLGNVVYFMCGPLTKPSVCSSLLRRMLKVLE
ncbi:hypothetical protein SELMODRAFT_413615 [Selaginella moellendorffii]|uniref:Dethiobiotin synthase n=1 Tax=Selaginella moellendorffii TaxID=88036 RepID=D8RQV0_SELML|nr:hypothetical protein SELMODRAFT_413615 [Selaginella moellendorffii]